MKSFNGNIPAELLDGFHAYVTAYVEVLSPRSDEAWLDSVTVASQSFIDEHKLVDADALDATQQYLHLSRADEG